MAIKERLTELERAAASIMQQAQALKAEFGFDGSNGYTTPRPSRERRTRSSSAVSLPRLIEAVLKPAGRPMTVTEILEENEKRGIGYTSGAENPADSVDIQFYKVANRYPIRKTGTRTWEWVNEQVNGSAEG